MMIVMEFLSTNPYPPGRQIGGLVIGLVVAIAHMVAQAIDDTGGPERDPQHHDCPQNQAWETKGNNEQGTEGQNTQVSVFQVETLPRINGEAFAVLFNKGLITGGFPIQG